MALYVTEPKRYHCATEELFRAKFNESIIGDIQWIGDRTR